MKAPPVNFMVLVPAVAATVPFREPPLVQVALTLGDTAGVREAGLAMTKPVGRVSTKDTLVKAEPPGLSIVKVKVL